MKKIIRFFIPLLILQSCVFAAGTYSNAVFYNIDGISNKQLVDRIINIKKAENQYIAPNSRKIDRLDDNNFYHVSFYIKEKDIILYAIINLNEAAIQEKKAKIGLELILKGYQTDNAKFYQINDLSKDEKKEILNLFEKEILNKIKQ